MDALRMPWGRDWLFVVRGGVNVVVEFTEPRKLSLTQGSRFGTRRAKGLKPLSMVWGGF